MSNSWLPTADALSSRAFSTSIVGWSCWTAEANSDALMLSPADTNATGPPAAMAAAFSFSTVPANFTVLVSIRPWKSLMSSSVSVTGLAAPSTSPTITGSWSEER